MRTLFFIILLAHAGTLSSRGQVSPGVPKKGENRITFSIGAFPHTYNQEAFDYWEYSEWHYGPNSINDFYHSMKPDTYRGRMVTYGSFSLDYGRMVAGWFNVGIRGTYTGFYRNIYDADTYRKTGTDNRHYFTVMPRIHFYFMRTRYVNLYGGGGVGISFTNYREWFDDRKVHVNGQVTALGITVSPGPLFFFSEVGYGATGVVNAGIGYRFGLN